MAKPPSAKANADASAGEQLELPTEAEAADAIVELTGLSELRAVRLGTCIKAIEAEHAGQVACTVAVEIGAGTSETQVDFFKDKKKWIAQPSVSQDELPFPDPKLL